MKVIIGNFRMPKFEGANWHKVNVATKAIEQFFFRFVGIQMQKI